MTCPAIGVMPMPANFKYKDVLQKGRPRHEKWDAFWMKHPPMKPGHWAKIFSPFDALDGFDERIAEKEILYEPQTELCEDYSKELDRRLGILKNLTWNTRMARANKVMVTVTAFVPCRDHNHSAFGIAGSYEKVSGMVLAVEMDHIRLLTETGEQRIRFSMIRNVESDAFSEDWSIA